MRWWPCSRPCKTSGRWTRRYLSTIISTSPAGNSTSFPARTTKRPRRSSPRTAPAAKFPADLRSGMDEVNAVRIVCGLRPLLYDEKLCEAAIEQAPTWRRTTTSRKSARDGKKDALGPSQAGRHDGFRREHLQRRKRRPQCRQGLVPRPGHHRTCSPIRPSGKVLAARFDLDADVRELRHRVGQCLRRMSALLRNQRHVVARAAVGVVVVAAPR